MPKRKAEPEPPPDKAQKPEAPKETTPPAPDRPEGPEKNPELKKKRGDIAKGVWDPKRSRELAKQMPSDKLVKQWEPVGEMFATMTDVGLMVAFGPEEVMKKVGSIEEREMVVQAWAARLAVEPPENIKAILTINLFTVYAFILLPRIQRVWIPKIQEWRAKEKEKKDGGQEKADSKGKAVGSPGGSAQGGGEVEGGGSGAGSGQGTPAGAN